MNESTTKLIKSAKVIDHVLKFLQGCLTAAVIVCAVFIPITLIFKEKVIITNQLVMDLGNISLNLADASFLNQEGIVGSLVIMMVLAIIMGLIGWYALKVLRSVITPMKEGRPFEQGISLKIRRLAWIALAGGIINEIGNAFIAMFKLRLYDLSKVFDSAVVTGYSFNYQVDGTFIIMFALMLILSFIFRYGETLQQESDETL